MSDVADQLSPEHAERARQIVAEAFTAHWITILQSTDKVAADRASDFLAGSRSARERLARRFYTSDRARKMAELNAAQIQTHLEPYLGHAIDYWLSEYGEFGDEAGDNYLAKLSTSEYVTIVDAYGSPGLLIDCYPGRGDLYDDLYERLLAGFSIGGVLRVYKSTGERFTPSEARSVRAGIRQQLLSVIRSEEGENAWCFDMNAGGIYTEGFEDEDLDRVVVVEAIQRKMARAARNEAAQKPWPSVRRLVYKMMTISKYIVAGY